MNSPLTIYAVIVCYELQYCQISALLDSLEAQGVRPIIIDNSEKSPLDETQITVAHHYHATKHNTGIATAQNIGIDIAREHHADAIVFFDQDSTIPENFIAELAQPIIDGKAMITAPVYQHEAQGFFYPMVKCNRYGWRKKVEISHGISPFFTRVTISSGSMVATSVFDKVGLLYEPFFIDHVDTEWFLRAANKGFKTLIVPSAIMQHRIGETVINLKGYKVSVHSPARRYYRIRNGVLLLKMKHIPKLLSLREVFSASIHQTIITLLCKEKRAYSHYYFKAIGDGIRNKTGKLEE